MKTNEKAKCPACGAQTAFPTGWHCVACLKEEMDKMTPEDWAREIGAVCDSVLGKQP